MKNKVIGVVWYTKSLSDTTPKGLIHSFSDGGYNTDCGKVIDTNGRWYIDYVKKHTCKKCYKVVVTK